MWFGQERIRHRAALLSPHRVIMSSRTNFVFPVLVSILAGVMPAKAADFVVRSIMVPDMKAVFGRVETTRIVPARARIGGSIRAIRVSEGDQVK
jgi:multidrug efflux pump subunit AcrA (membrane-fusion protein)